MILDCGVSSTMFLYQEKSHVLLHYIPAHENNALLHGVSIRRRIVMIQRFLNESKSFILKNRDALGRINYQDNLLQNLLHVHLNDICKTYLIYSTIEEVSDAVKPHLVYIEESHINNKVRNATLNTVLVIPTKVLVKHDFDSVTSYFSSSSCLIYLMDKKSRRET